MPIELNGQTYYRTSETRVKTGISRATLFRWLKAGVLEDIMPRDRKGWRLFTENDINIIRSEATRVTRKGVLLEGTKKWASQESIRGGSYGQEDSSH